MKNFPQQSVDSCFPRFSVYTFPRFRFICVVFPEFPGQLRWLFRHKFPARREPPAYLRVTPLSARSLLLLLPNDPVVIPITIYLIRPLSIQNPKSLDDSQGITVAHHAWKGFAYVYARRGRISQ